MEKCIVITTLSDDLDIIQNIQKKLLEQHLVTGCQISSVESSYWWEDKIHQSHEYLLQMRTTKRLYQNIELIIKKMHNYKVPEISYYEINGSNEILEWIYKNTK